MGRAARNGALHRDPTYSSLLSALELADDTCSVRRPLVSVLDTDGDTLNDGMVSAYPDREQEEQPSKTARGEAEARPIEVRHEHGPEVGNGPMPPFLSKLLDMMSDPNLVSYIMWSENGRSIIVVDALKLQVSHWVVCLGGAVCA